MDILFRDLGLVTIQQWNLSYMATPIGLIGNKMHCRKNRVPFFYSREWQQAGGIASDETIGKVEKLLAQIGSQSALWEFIPFDVFACEFSSRPRTISVSEFCDLWKNRSLPGRLVLQGVAMLDAPVYSDSIIVSGSRGITKLALALGLEARAVHPAHVMPISMWG